MDVRAATNAELDALADLLESQTDEVWDLPSLCVGWRVREVVAHLTMPVRYPAERFGAELAAAGGDFTRVSDTVAQRDGALEPAALVADLRHETLRAWEPPGGGAMGGLVHVVVHSLDVTVPLAVERPPDEALHAVLDVLTSGGVHRHFGVDLDGVALHATDSAWSHGVGAPVRARAGDLALLLCGRDLPADRLGGALRRATAAVT